MRTDRLGRVEAGIGLGSNLGDKAAAIRAGLARFCDGAEVELVAISSLHRTEPWGGVEQDWFLNAVALVRTGLAPLALLARAKAVERALGRTETVRWGPRVLDIDLLWVGEATLDLPELTLPHPGLFDRDFVLRPLREISARTVVAGRRLPPPATGA